jgi:hypothetical protein
MRVKPAILAVTQDIAEMAHTLGVHLTAANRRFSWAYRHHGAFAMAIDTWSSRREQASFTVCPGNQVVLSAFPTTPWTQL